MAIFKWLDNKDNLIEAYIINDLRESSMMRYINREIWLKDSSRLFVKEFTDSAHRKYSFHWQTASGQLIIRWDNAPHFPLLPNFPHHKHLADLSVEPSHDISIEEVVYHIHRFISDF